jgi:thiol-disulfide isomerase/thioredoxin
MTLAPTVPIARASGMPAPTDAPNAEPALKVPDTLPDIHLADLQGQRRALRNFGRRPLIVNFWATWCEPCRREMPLLTALRHEYRDERLEIVGIAVDFRDSVSAFLEKTPLAYPQLVGEEDGMEAARAFGMQMVLPFSVFVDEQDRIIAMKVGELHRDEALAILDAMRGLRAGKVSLADTRARITRQLGLLAAVRATQAASAGAAGR